MAILKALVLLLGSLIAVVGVGLVGLAIWSRRGEGRPDRRGVRTVCRFSGGARYMTDEERADESGSTSHGEGVVTALAAALGTADVTTTTPDADDVGWAVRASLGRHKAYLQVLHIEEEGDVWVLLVIDPSSGGPGSTQLLPLVDKSIRTLR